MVVGGMAILLFGSQLRAGTVFVGSHPTPHAVSHHAGIGVWIGAPTPVPTPLWDRPAHTRVIVTRPWQHRFVHIMPPRPGVVVVRPPVVERVIVDPMPPVIVRSPAPVVEEGTITVWITNSNGSRTSVKLTRRGDCYIGPRNEWYTNMPTNEQLRIVYGF
jgi:hypothetical protein